MKKADFQSESMPDEAPAAVAGHPPLQEFDETV